jgi:hypothetical protein
MSILAHRVLGMYRNAFLDSVLSCSQRVSGMWPFLIVPECFPWWQKPIPYFMLGFACEIWRGCFALDFSVEV